ncbi:hypothetical protein GCM10010251_63200 [Streptomyces aurantiogriseus]|uniref:Uncharacterized protein n=1 Tax=Streptomyces aurantiogriseus TaxID=66870 RepID=A0A918KWQ5_9ACTN|nr:hypothetical protein GCM10010251_63200 [Streptomyces aurantiogriseus]
MEVPAPPCVASQEKRREVAAEAATDSYGPGTGSGVATGPRIQISGPRCPSVVRMIRTSPRPRPLPAPAGRVGRPWNEAVTSW